MAAALSGAEGGLRRATGGGGRSLRNEGGPQALVSGLAARPRREPIPAAPIHPAGGTWFWQPQDPKAVVKSPDWVRPPGGDEHAPPQAGETGAWRGSSSQRQESRAGDASHAGAAGGPGGGGSRAHAADTARRGAGPGRPGRDRTRRVEGHGSKTTSVSVSWHVGPLTNLAVLGKHPGLPVNDDALRKTRPRAGALTAARTTTETRRERATASPTTGCGPRAARPLSPSLVLRCAVQRPGHRSDGGLAWGDPPAAPAPSPRRCLPPCGPGTPAPRGGRHASPRRRTAGLGSPAAGTGARAPRPCPLCPGTRPPHGTPREGFLF